MSNCLNGMSHGSKNRMAHYVFLTLLFRVKENIRSIFTNCLSLRLFHVGYYLYMDASKLKPKDLAKVSYHFSNISQSYCQMNFFYYMYGAGLGVLRLIVQPKGGQSKEVLYTPCFIQIHVDLVEYVTVFMPCPRRIVERGVLQIATRFKIRSVPGQQSRVGLPLVFPYPPLPFQ